MPIQLTTPFNAGDFDGSLTHVKIQQFTLFPQGGSISLTVQHGKVVEGAFQPGTPVEGRTVQRFQVTGEDYTTMVATMSAAAGEVYYDKVAHLLYQWLIDEEHYIGTIV